MEVSVCDRPSALVQIQNTNTEQPRLLLRNHSNQKNLMAIYTLSYIARAYADEFAAVRTSANRFYDVCDQLEEHTKSMGGLEKMITETDKSLIALKEKTQKQWEKTTKTSHFGFDKLTKGKEKREESFKAAMQEENNAKQKLEQLKIDYAKEVELIDRLFEDKMKLEKEQTKLMVIYAEIFDNPEFNFRNEKAVQSEVSFLEQTVSQAKENVSRYLQAILHMKTIDEGFARAIYTVNQISRPTIGNFVIPDSIKREIEAARQYLPESELEIPTPPEIPKGKTILSQLSMEDVKDYFWKIRKGCRQSLERCESTLAQARAQIEQHDAPLKKMRSNWLTARRRTFELILDGEEDVAKLDALFGEDASSLAPAYVDDGPSTREQLPAYH
ncbi:hypothetical protein BC938DRAFT_483199 [Jimgerdemannia flammicorona]|uniref:Uncharacterized protein n=1 Tax=Jimgerdemannia flammicorona TaxID=994334 RepID=A0A433QVV5_9FUNG|nr:hypothetical protein BC938DRAFT_483199 [Jimgerdemannia flammicorona]